MKLFTSTTPSIITVLLLAAFQPARAKSAVDIILQIMPGSGSCAAGATECRTAEQAAPRLISAFQAYGIINTAEMAAILATVGAESGDLAWKTNQNPGRAGQGSSNMQMYNQNYEFAQSIPALKAKVDAIDGASDASPSDETMNAVRALVIDDEYNWMTGPWYYSTKCTNAQKSAFKQGGDLDAAFSEYTLTCIGAGEIEAERAQRWTNAKAAFGL